MEQQIASDAVEVINSLLKATIDDDEPVDYDQALRVRDELQHQASYDYDIPEIGDVLHDNDSPHWSDDDRVKVVDVLHGSANQVYVDGDSHRTVADHNPSHPADAPVVVAHYIGGNDTEYKFPVTRLE